MDVRVGVQPSGPFSSSFCSPCLPSSFASLSLSLTFLLPQIPLGRYFPEYAGGNDLQKAAKYILWKFMQENRAKLTVYPHVTQATNTKHIQLVFAAVKETILQDALKDSGIL
ncbi:hypothetical protein K438DRAFT_1622430 [Mycena galopus ATCC 62051]|nr:hypothetical protein K438DRAFT_1622430 [Mycena galopus ATCC 62051]